LVRTDLSGRQFQVVEFLVDFGGFVFGQFELEHLCVFFGLFRIPGAHQHGGNSRTVERPVYHQLVQRCPVGLGDRADLVQEGVCAVEIFAFEQTAENAVIVVINFAGADPYCSDRRR